MSIGTKPRIDGHREIEERENALLHAREGREMTPPAAALTDEGQRQPLKGLQQAFSRRVSGRPLRVGLPRRIGEILYARRYLLGG